MAGTARPIKIRLRERTRVLQNGCHELDARAYRDKQGYTRIWHVGAKQLAHRVAYETFVGPIPEGMQIDHLCGNRACINPEHLEAVTPLVNTMRSSAPSAINAAKTHCDHGHAFTPENTRQRKDRPGRHCRRCDADRQARYRARAAA